MSRRVRFGVIGYGNIGRRHVDVIRQQPDADLKLVCDTDASKLGEAPVPTVDNWRYLISRPDIDVVSICTPHHLHAEMAIEAAIARKDVLVEKPMALSGHDAREMVIWAKKSGVRLFVVLQNRFNPTVQALSELLASGGLGTVSLATCNVLWHRPASYYTDSPWRGRRAFEKGALYTQAVHFLDLLTWWFGEAVHAEGLIGRAKQPIEIEDTGSASMYLANGVLANVVWSTCLRGPENLEGSITVVGEKGTVKIGGAYLNRFDVWKVDGIPQPDVPEGPPPNRYAGGYQGSASNHVPVYREVIAAALGQEHVCPTADVAVDAIDAIDMLYEHATVVDDPERRGP